MDKPAPVEKPEPTGPMAVAATHRRPDHATCTAEEQWEDDKRLGILDWDGDPKK